MTPRGSAGAERRERIYRRDGYRCVYCGEAFTSAELTLDHVEPRMRGGDHSEGNLVTCCRACNAAKAGAAAWQYLADDAALRERFLSAVERCDAQHAQPVWPRLVRAIREAASE